MCIILPATHFENSVSSVRNGTSGAQIDLANATTSTTNTVAEPRRQGNKSTDTTYNSQTFIQSGTQNVRF